MSIGEYRGCTVNGVKWSKVEGYDKGPTLFVKRNRVNSSVWWSEYCLSGEEEHVLHKCFEACEVSERLGELFDANHHRFSYKTVCCRGGIHGGFWRFPTDMVDEVISIVHGAHVLYREACGI